MQQNCGQVFRYAVATARAESDPSRDLRGALTPWRPQHYATLTDPREVGRLLRDIESREGSFATKCAMKLAPRLFMRPGELRRAEWSEIDLDAAEWRIPVAKIKGRIMHNVPLAKQAVRILTDDLRPLARDPPGRLIKADEICTLSAKCWAGFHADLGRPEPEKTGTSMSSYRGQ